MFGRKTRQERISLIPFRELLSLIIIPGPFGQGVSCSAAVGQI